MENNNITYIVCPHCQYKFNHCIFGNIIEDLLCPSCNKKYANYGSCIDFTEDLPDKIHYNSVYKSNNKNSKLDVDFKSIRSIWYDKRKPEYGVFLEHLPIVHNKTILLIGNGVSEKELVFLEDEASIIYSDISIDAVCSMKSKYKYGKYDSRITFHAIDGMKIPLPSDSIDIIIGFAFVHHLDEVDGFLAEIHRVLKKEGVCVFYDNAYSNLWQKLKFSVLKPLMIYSHNKHGFSPEDKKATRRGGFLYEEIVQYKNQINFSGMFYYRFGLLYHLFERGITKIFNPYSLIMLRRILVPLLYRIDNYLSKRIKLYRDNTLNLVWGFKK